MQIVYDVSLVIYHSVIMVSYLIQPLPPAPSACGYFYIATLAMYPKM